MAKNIFQIKPKLPDEAKATLPVQDFSPEKILEIVRQSQPSEQDGGGAATSEKTIPPKTSRKSATKKTARKPSPKTAQSKLETDPNKRPQGRPPRQAPVKRISSDLPAELYDRVQAEIRAQGYTLNGFLAKVLREYFSR